MQTQTLDQFLREVQNKALRMAELAGLDREEALDVVQDVMFKFVDNYANNAQSEWPPLFYRILHNRVNDHFRRQKVRHKWLTWLLPKDDEDDVDLLDNIADEKAELPEHLLQRQCDSEQLVAMVGRLPVRQQQAFLLRAWEGLNVEQTAEAMSCTTGSVKTHYSRAVHKLRQLLEEHDETTE